MAWIRRALDHYYGRLADLDRVSPPFPLGWY